MRRNWTTRMGRFSGTHAAWICLAALAVGGTAGCGDDEAVGGPGAQTAADALGKDGSVPKDVSSSADAAAALDAQPTPDAGADTAHLPDAPVGDAGCLDDGDCPQPDNACQISVCQAGGSCKQMEAPVGKACDDGNPCTQVDVCKLGVCAGAAVACDDGNPCTADACDPQQGCQSGPNQAACEDGNACTQGDTCAGGACVSGEALACDDGNPCTDDSCDKLKGCLVTANTLACDDGNACTAKDTCSGGVCLPGAATDCDDGNPCTNDTCAPKSGCQWADHTKPCDDGNTCTAGDTCAQGACKAGGAVDCSDGNPCTDDACDPAKGCQSKPNAAVCSDNNVCTEGDSCAGGVCVPGVSQGCDDAKACTSDSCHPVQGCQHIANSAACDDGDACTAGDACKAGACVGGAKLGCDDGNACTDDSCDAAKGCQSKANSAACDDGNACTLVDQCAAGQCAPGKAKSCDDGNLCTNDACDPTKGCQHAFNTLPCGDDNACTGGDGCKDGKCQPGGVTDCDDGNLCTSDSCDPAKGCVHLANTATCTDNNACTVGDACAAGQCQPGQAKSCDDGNGCTSESCHPLQGCVQANNTLACNDGDVCTGADVCADGSCKSGQPLACNDGNPCTADACDPLKGCLSTPHTKTCEDGSVCTVGDACSGGVCKPGLSKDCDDGNPCTADSCEAVKGCLHGHNTAPCSDGSVCTVGDLCKGGTCQPGPAQACNDGNPCTADSCDKAVGCVASPNTAPCDDGNACTAQDACAAGTCKGKGVDCDDGDACTVDLCDAKKGCQHSAPAGFLDCGGKCVNAQTDPAHCGKCTESCKAGALCLAGGCKTIVCIPYSKGACYSGAAGTSGVGACKAGERTCNNTGTDWLPGCAGEVTPASAEDCDTPVDDDCDGKTNEASICGPAEYTLSPVPTCGSYCYYDEAHNVAVSGSPVNNSGVGQWAIGQLLDGKRGVDSWSADLGAGPAWEWVGWSAGDPVVTFRFPKDRLIAAITLGLNNYISGGVQQPLGVQIATSLDGKTWGKTETFTQAGGGLATIPAGKRGDVKVAFTEQKARYLRVTFQRIAWTFVDEVVFH